MRLIAKKTVVNFYEQRANSKASLAAFMNEVRRADWKKAGDVIENFPTVDVIAGKRFVFNIKGNHYRLVADIEFIKGIVFVVWLGTHAEYDKIDVKAVNYVKSN